MSKELDRVIEEMDFEFLGSGEHSISVDGFRTVLNNDHFVFLDVRTDEENKYQSYPFATHIPLSELPSRHGELPRDKCVIVFCSSIFRGAAGYVYLRAQGFEEVKGLAATSEELIKIFKPSPLAKM